jgi:hypothetical protein
MTQQKTKAKPVKSRQEAAQVRRNDRARRRLHHFPRSTTLDMGRGRIIVQNGGGILVELSKPDVLLEIEDGHVMVTAWDTPD